MSEEIAEGVREPTNAELMGELRTLRALVEELLRRAPGSYYRQTPIFPAPEEAALPPVLEMTFGPAAEPEKPRPPERPPAPPLSVRPEYERAHKAMNRAIGKGFVVDAIVPLLEAHPWWTGATSSWEVPGVKTLYRVLEGKLNWDASREEYHGPLSENKSKVLADILESLFKERK